MTDPENGRVALVVRSVERLLRDRPESGALDPDTVFALDIVTHALEFTRTTDGLPLWREALWGRRLPEQARVAVIRMLDYVMSAAARGETGAIRDICDCLNRVVGSDVFGGSVPHIGGIRRSSLNAGRPAGNAAAYSSQVSRDVNVAGGNQRNKRRNYASS